VTDHECDRYRERLASLKACTPIPVWGIREGVEL
jgi:hypothetical protein